MENHHMKQQAYEAMPPQFEPFANFTLEDHVRHLSNWPRDLAENKDDLLDSILALCGVWTKRLDAKD